MKFQKVKKMIKDLKNKIMEVEKLIHNYNNSVTVKKTL
jgi:hypothetical protein